jgi:hypothetical protein
VQWEISGGFCGAFSIQQCGLSWGAWVSQDLVRKANRDQTGIEHNMHGDRTLGYEVVPVNVAYTAGHLGFVSDEWNYNNSSPQTKAYKAWVKGHLVKGECVVWFPICKGDSHDCYPGSCPNGGTIDHVEPIFGIFSNHSLTDPTVYDDDVILHASDQDLEPYYRPMSTLEDGLAMQGNCLHAGSGFGKNEMYPCFYEKVTYGLALTGLQVKGSLPISLQVDILTEPNIRQGDPPKPIHGTVTVSGLSAGSQYTLFRFNSTKNLPSRPPFAPTAEYTTDFTASSSTWKFQDPHTFMSNSATYYLAATK